MKCEELAAILTRNPTCEQGGEEAKYITECLYPSAEPVCVYIARVGDGFRVNDGGGALRSAIQHDRNVEGFLDKASKRHSVYVRAGALYADPKSEDWLYAAILAVANASAQAARLALESTLSRSESGLRSEIYDRLKQVVPTHKIARNFDHRGRSGHMWEVDYAVREESLILIKAVVQNGNSINSNYAAFGDIGDEPNVFKFSVFRDELKPDSSTLLRQVAQLVPLTSVQPMTERHAYQSRLN